MKTRQYDTDEAGDYGDAVPVLLEILHNSGFGYKVKMAAGVLLQKHSVKEYNKQVGKVCTISFERPVNYLCDARHVFPPKCEAWTHFNN